jgi:hypothetical protein
MHDCVGPAKRVSETIPINECQIAEALIKSSKSKVTGIAQIEPFFAVRFWNRVSGHGRARDRIELGNQIDGASEKRANPLKKLEMLAKLRRNGAGEGTTAAGVLLERSRRFHVEASLYVGAGDRPIGKHGPGG